MSFPFQRKKDFISKVLDIHTIERYSPFIYNTKTFVKTDDILNADGEKTGIIINQCLTTGRLGHDRKITFNEAETDKMVFTNTPILYYISIKPFGGDSATTKTL